MSNINPYNIDGTYPVAGQDNDSQGFRDNFTNTKNNFIYTKQEIEDLSAKAILKTKLIGSTLDNNMNGNPIVNAAISGFREPLKEVATSGGSSPISFTDGHYQTISFSGRFEITGITGWPSASSNTHAKIRLEINVTTSGSVLHLPFINDWQYATLETFAGVDVDARTITFNSAGIHVFDFSTKDGGNTIIVQDLTRNRAKVEGDLTVTGKLSVPANTPATANANGVPGQIAWDSTHIYVCVATNTWKRASIASW